MLPRLRGRPGSLEAPGAIERGRRGSRSPRKAPVVCLESIRIPKFRFEFRVPYHTPPPSAAPSSPRARVPAPSAPSAAPTLRARRVPPRDRPSRNRRRSPRTRRAPRAGWRRSRSRASLRLREGRDRVPPIPPRAAREPDYSRLEAPECDEPGRESDPAPPREPGRLPARLEPGRPARAGPRAGRARGARPRRACGLRRRFGRRSETKASVFKRVGSRAFAGPRTIRITCRARSRRAPARRSRRGDASGAASVPPRRRCRSRDAGTATPRARPPEPRAPRKSGGRGGIGLLRGAALTVKRRPRSTTGRGAEEGERGGGGTHPAPSPSRSNASSLRNIGASVRVARAPAAARTGGTPDRGTTLQEKCPFAIPQGWPETFL